LQCNSSTSRKTKERTADSTPQVPRPYEQLRHSSAFPSCCPNCMCIIFSQASLTTFISPSWLQINLTHSYSVMVNYYYVSVEANLLQYINHVHILLKVKQLQSKELFKAWILTIAFSQHINTIVHFSCNYSQICLSLETNRSFYRSAARAQGKHVLSLTSWSVINNLPSRSILFLLVTESRSMNNN
jgi:hypothetical protein